MSVYWRLRLAAMSTACTGSSDTGLSGDGVPRFGLLADHKRLPECLPTGSARRIGHIFILTHLRREYCCSAEISSHRVPRYPPAVAAVPRGRGAISDCGCHWQTYYGRLSPV